MPLSCGVWPASSVPCFRGALRSAWAGTGLGADPGYMDALYHHPSDIYSEEVRPTASLFDGLQNADFFVTVSGLVKEVATLLSKITRDLRPHEQRPALGLHGGPAAALSLGSSIMPGKINPTLSEMVIQIAHQVVGNDVAVSMATTRANLTSTFGMPPSTSASSRACTSSATNSSS